MQRQLPSAIWLLQGLRLEIQTRCEQHRIWHLEAAEPQPGIRGLFVCHSPQSGLQQPQERGIHLWTGATLATATCQAVARAGGPPLALQLLICPILDYSRSTPSKLELSSGYLVDQATLDHDLMHYAPEGADPTNPRISPLLAADVTGMPRTLIHTAEFDPLRDEGRNYFERLTQARNEVSYTCHPGMIHLFYGLGAVIPYARTAFEQIGGEIRAALA